MKGLIPIGVLCAISLATPSLANNVKKRVHDLFDEAASQNRSLGQRAARSAGDDIADKLARENMRRSTNPEALPVPRYDNSATNGVQRDTRVRRLQPVPDHQMKLVIDHQHMPAIRAVTKVPDNWIAKPPDAKHMDLPGQAKPYRDPNLERGVVLLHPDNPHTYVRVMPGNPASPHRQSAYVTAHGPGGFRDKYGQVLNLARWKDAGMEEEYLRRIHIPLEEFEFRKMKLN